MLDRFPPVLLVAVGGMIGAVVRYWISGHYRYSNFPIGTLIVNIVGSGLLGFLVTVYSLNLIENNWLILIGTGFLGSLTTMATFVVETIRLSENTIPLGFTNFFSTLFLVFVSAYMGQVLAFVYAGKLS